MRSTIVAAMLAVSSLVAVPAFAAPARAEGPAKVLHGEHGDKAKFPMAAAEFKQKVDARQTKARARMEERASKLNAEQAKELRAKFDAGVAKINAEVQTAIADGTVTKEEAQKVRETARSVHPHGGKHARRHGKK